MIWGCLEVCWGWIAVPKGPVYISKPHIIVPIFEGWGKGFVAAKNVHMKPGDGRTRGAQGRNEMKRRGERGFGSRVERVLVHREGRRLTAGQTKKVRGEKWICKGEERGKRRKKAGREGEKGGGGDDGRGEEKDAPAYTRHARHVFPARNRIDRACYPEIW